MSRLAGKAADWVAGHPLLLAASVPVLLPLSPFLLLCSPLLLLLAVLATYVYPGSKRDTAIPISFTAGSEILSSAAVPPSRKQAAEPQAQSQAAGGITEEDRHLARTAGEAERSRQADPAPDQGGAASTAEDAGSGAAEQHARNTAEPPAATIAQATLPAAANGTGAGASSAAAGATGGAAVLARLRCRRVHAAASPLVLPSTQQQLSCRLCRAQRAKKAVKPVATAKPSVLVLFASQTGTGQEIAVSVGTEAAQHGCTAKVHLCTLAPCCFTYACRAPHAPRCRSGAQLR